MKKEFRVHIYKHGTNNDSLLTMIGNCNEGITTITLTDIIGYINCNVAQWPIINKDKFTYAYSPEINTLDISEDGKKTWTLQIREVEVHQLPYSESECVDDLENVL